MMETIVDGNRYGRLVVVKANSTKNSSGRLFSTVLCDCGSESVTRNENLRSGKTKSCGCYHRDRVSQTSKKEHISHGKAGVDGKVSAIYHAWLKVKDCIASGWQIGAHTRCHEMDPRWESFQCFLDDFSDIGPTMTIARVNHQLPWSKENCVVAAGRRHGGSKTKPSRRIFQSSDSHSKNQNGLQP